MSSFSSLSRRIHYFAKAFTQSLNKSVILAGYTYTNSGRKGATIIMDRDGYKYCRNKILKSGERWLCSKRISKKCPVTLYVKGDYFEPQNSKQNAITVSRSEKLVWYRQAGGKALVEEQKALASNSGKVVY